MAIDDEHRFKNELLPLINKKILILDGSPITTIVDRLTIDQRLAINMEFTAKAFLIKIKSSHCNEKVDETEDKKIYEEFMFEMKIKIESAVMRLLKTHRVLSFNKILENVPKMMVGSHIPSKKSIQAALESLMERDFVQRDANDKNLFIYN